MDKRDIELVQMPIPNINLLDAVIEYIEEHPEEWDQTYWASLRTADGTVGWRSDEPCGTTACFAGTALILSGYTLEAELQEGEGYRPYWRAVFRDPEGVEVNAVMYRAQDLLGITEEDAIDIFLHMPDEDRPDEDPLHWFKVKVEKLRGRYLQQIQAFDRIARELIESVPELEAVLKPGYLCPESQEVLLKALREFRGEGE